MDDIMNQRLHTVGSSFPPVGLEANAFRAFTFLSSSILPFRISFASFQSIALDDT